MKVTYLKDSHGMKEGQTKELPDAIAKDLVNRGVAESKDYTPPKVTKDIKPEKETKGK